MAPSEEHRSHECVSGLGRSSDRNPVSCPVHFLVVKLLESWSLVSAVSLELVLKTVLAVSPGVKLVESLELVKVVMKVGPSESPLKVLDLYLNLMSALEL